MAKRPSGGKSAGKTAPRKRSTNDGSPEAKSYTHPEATSPLRPDVGVQKQFRKKKPPKTYRYDASLSPALEWDEGPAREQGEALLRQIIDAGSLEEAKTAAEDLRAMSRPFLSWAGKAERQSFEVPTLPLFVHERLSTKAILETVQAHARDKQTALDLFGDPRRDLADQVLRAYEHRDRWVNRMILGDSLVVMNSLLEYEGLGGQVQMIYIDPPYGVKFGSNFQPFVRKREVEHGRDESLAREPETIQAYRDTWSLGLHSYMTFLRDRFEVARRLLSLSGSLFVQISDENVDLVRTLLGEVFGRENLITSIVFQKTSSEDTGTLANTADYLLWFARDRERLKYYPLLREKRPGEEGARQYVHAMESETGQWRKLTPDEMAAPERIPQGWRVFRRGFPLTSQHYSPTRSAPFLFEGTPYSPGANRQWSVSPEAGLPALVAQGRIYSTGKSLNGIMFLDDMPGTEMGNVWTDTGTGSFTEDQVFVVQTSEKVIERCLLMCTEPGDLVLDPTCGSGTTAHCAEKWGRRWITIDTSRVPLTLARQRLLTACYPWFQLVDPNRGPTGGFSYETRTHTQNRKGDGYGIAAQHSLSSLAGEESPQAVLFRENPERDYSVTRVAGPFAVEATIPVPVDFDADGVEDSGSEGVEEHGDFVDRMVEVLRRSPDLRLPGNRTVRFEQVRRPAKTLSLSAEAMVNGKPVAVVFGPEHGAVSEKLVFNAGSEAAAKRFTHLYVVGFAIEPNARQLVEQAEAVMGVPATYVQATPDLVLGDLLKTMRSSQVFSVCGLPEVKVEKVVGQRGKPPRWQVTLLGMDIFDPATMEADHRPGAEVPAWFLDTDYDANRCFRVCQAFFPKTSAWDNLKRALRADYDESLWGHLSGTTSAPFEAGEQRQVAVKVIDERGNELLVVQPLRP
jgi:adenine-specific DNA-methyltransferase